MRGRLLDLSVGMNGKQRVTIELDDDYAEAFGELAVGDVEVAVKKWRRRRSLDANAYAWALIGKIAEALPIGKAEVYRNAIRDIGGVSEIVCLPADSAKRMKEVWEGRGLGWQAEAVPSKLPGCVNMVLYYGSSVYDTRQMSQLIDSLIEDARSLGIETADQGYIDSLLSQHERNSGNDA